VIRTRVGYAGGTKENPTYHSLGNHSETIQIDYDPSQISYEDLLEVFWDSHSPTSRPWSQQYASIIFYHDDEQRQLAIESMAREDAKYQTPLFTEIAPFSRFYLAEDYHQKYRLQQVPELAKEFKAIYPDGSSFVKSTAAARVNGYLDGYGTCEALLAEVADLGLSEQGSKKLLDIVCSSGR
jgi:peptide-methionine (S)-S-oxide reductase